MGYWKSWADFVDMGGRGFYVWASFGFVLALIVIELVMIRLRKQAALKASSELDKDHA
jgi:heme exporter protein D